LIQLITNPSFIIIFLLINYSLLLKISLMNRLTLQMTLKYFVLFVLFNFKLIAFISFTLFLIHASISYH